ncbi:hypothetical protein ABEW59_24905 [Bacillus wiedmannii]|uniref:hypothetical protein n=1 Tax=Bacillus wiedmannii TaxID=1890302 RepID=UPI003D193A3C
MEFYNFYFDESSHHRAITYKETGLNIYKEAENDLFIGFFWGFNRKKVNLYRSRYLEIENELKAIYGLGEEQEFKGTIIHKKNFQYGFNSFKTDTIKVYSKLFGLIDNESIIVHIHMYSKTEYLILQYFEEFNLPAYANKRAFIYSIIKFLFNYRNEKLMAGLFSNDKMDSKRFLKNLKSMLKIVISKTHNVKRKVEETPKLQELLFVLNNTDIKMQPKNKYEWDYIPLFEGLSKLLKELEIGTNKVNLTIDPEGTKRIFNAANQQDFGSVSDEEDSSENGLIRVADFFSNMFHRLTLALYDSLKEDLFVNVDTHNYVTKRILNEKWFDINNEEIYQLYVSLNKILRLNNGNYFTIFNGIFFDYAILVVSLVTYISEEYDDFEHFKSITPNMHAEDFNEYAAKIIQGEFVRNFYLK